MSRIRIEDLSVDAELAESDLKEIFGAGLSSGAISAARDCFAKPPVPSPPDELPAPAPDHVNPFLRDVDTQAALKPLS